MEHYYMEDKQLNFLSIHFPSIIDLMEYKPNWGNENDRTFKQYMTGGFTRDKKWLGPTCTSHDEVIRGAMLGDTVLWKKHLTQMVDQLREATGRLKKDYKQVIKSAKRKPMFGAFGDEVDIHKVYQGRLDTAWRRTKRIEVGKETKLVTLFIQISGTSGWNAVESLWRSAAAILLMEDLLNAGKSVKIVVGGYATGVTRKGHNMTMSIVVKEYSEKLSVERLAAMTHLGFYRTFGFSVKACQPYLLEYSLGASADLKNDKMPIQFRDDIHKGHSKFVVMDRCTDSSSAVRSLKKATEQMKEFSNETK